MTVFVVSLVVSLGGLALYAVRSGGGPGRPGVRTASTGRRCPACGEFLPAGKPDRDRHLEGHVVERASRGGPRFTWVCQPGCGPAMEWTNRHAAAMGLALHLHKRHHISPVLS